MVAEARLNYSTAHCSDHNRWIEARSDRRNFETPDRAKNIDRLMDSPDLNRLVIDLLIVLAAGFVAGTICKRIGLSLIVGYLVIGAIIGEGSLRLVGQSHDELELLAHAGALLLLFSVGLEISVAQFARMSREILTGGAVQMLLVAAPLTAIAAMGGLSWRAAFLVGAAGALSSTILVFKALTEWGESTSVPGRRAIGVLLFQDVALVPLMLLVPLLTGSEESSLLKDAGVLLAQSLFLIVAVVIARWFVGRAMIPLLTRLRSVELIVLFTLCVLGSVCWGCYSMGLPSAMGALAAGLILNGNRISHQIDTLTLPFRETFAVVFFVTLGTLLEPMVFLEEPLLLTAGIVGIWALKSLAATIALRLTGLSWQASAGMGIGLAQLGEFSFLLLAEGVHHEIVDARVYNLMLFIAMGTLIATPQLIKIGLRWSLAARDSDPIEQMAAWPQGEAIQHALVIGLGPVGRQITSRLELLGVDVCLIDLSPINLHDYAMQGFHTVAGDAQEPDVLQRAEVSQCRLAVVCVPDDEAANRIVATLRELNPRLAILVRCRYLSSIMTAKKRGADAVVSEEGESTGALLRLCVEVVESSKLQ